MTRVRPRSRWLEIEAWLLVLLVVGVYFSRMTTLTIRGEESRRARVAYEMLETGDWIVPRVQGVPWLSRPPLHNWAIAITAMATGDVDPIAIRLPSVLSTLLTTLLVYGYTRNFLAPLGAFAAGASFATMGHIMELARLGETEALFTLLLSGSLLLWHSGYSRGWPPTLTWVLGYVLVALAALAKAPQPPVYFIGSVVIFLILRRDWRWLLGWSHVGGILAFVLVFGAWQVPFYLKLGWQGVREIWLSEVAMRFSDSSVTAVAHLATYPFEILVATLPWSLLLTCFLNRGFRERIGEAQPYVIFLTICILVAFPSCWLPPGARGRYFMPLYPCIASLIGLVVQRCCDSAPGSSCLRVWGWYLKGLTGTMVAAALAVLGTSLLTKPDRFVWAQPPGFALGYALVAVGTAALVMWSRGEGRNSHRWGVGILAVAGFLGLSYTGVMINRLANDSVDTRTAVARLRQQLPNGHRMVSLGQVHHLFAYYYRDPITPIDWPSDGRELNGEGTYFCFDRDWHTNMAIPFEWEEVAAISVARYRRHREQWTVVIGRRLPARSVTSLLLATDRST